MRRRKLRNLDELEEMVEIRRSVAKSFTPADAERLERRILGRSWGRPRKKMDGWPK